MYRGCSEVLTAVGGYPGTVSQVVQSPLFLPLPRSSSPLYNKVAVGAPTHTLLPSVCIIFLIMNIIFIYIHYLSYIIF